MSSGKICHASIIAKIKSKTMIVTESEAHPSSGAARSPSGMTGALSFSEKRSRMNTLDSFFSQRQKHTRAKRPTARERCALDVLQ